MQTLYTAQYFPSSKCSIRYALKCIYAPQQSLKLTKQNKNSPTFIIGVAFQFHFELHIEMQISFIYLPSQSFLASHSLNKNERCCFFWSLVREEKTYSELPILSFPI
jgi:hypothetical protein